MVYHFYYLDGSWRKFDEEGMKHINWALSQDVCQLQIEFVHRWGRKQTTYTLNFETMFQTNMGCGTSRKVAGYWNDDPEKPLDWKSCHANADRHIPSHAAVAESLPTEVPPVARPPEDHDDLEQTGMSRSSFDREGSASKWKKGMFGATRRYWEAEERASDAMASTNTAEESEQEDTQPGATPKSCPQVRHEDRHDPNLYTFEAWLRTPKSTK